MFEPFQKFIARAATQYGVSTEIKAAQICQDFRSLMPKIFGDNNEAELHIQPAFYRNFTLVISTESPAWSQEVIMRKTKIIEEMNKKAGREIIKNLRTQLKSQ